MKKIFAGIPPTKFIAAASAFTWTIAIANSAGAAQLQEARVTQVVNDVKLLLEQSAPRPAAISDLVRHGTAVRTGTQSRSELTFADLTITRLGANTIFSFKEGTREMNLIDGAILFQVPKGSGGATIRTVGVTAAITGTTGIGEFHPATTSHPQPFSKWLCLEGTFHLYLPNGQSVEVGPGKMVTTDGKSFSKVLTFDIAKLTSTSLFFNGFDQPLASMNLITLESQNQLASSLLATTTTNPLDPTKIVNVTSQAVVAEQAQTSPSSSVSPPPPTPPPPTPPPPTPPTPPVTPTPPISPTPPPPTPSKFGTPSVISSPVPYLITSGTVITTDPSITTNGVTDFGKIYRGPGDDGAFSLWAFGSTSAFDTALGVDNFFADPTRFPIAVFKFQSLSLTGNPTIDTSNGGVTKLALIGVDGITSGPPGGTLTFTGLDLLALGTVNGSINLTSDISFQDISVLAMYARGAGSNLILDSPISNVGDLKLGAEGSIQLTNPGTMNVGQFDATAGDDLTLQIGGSLLLDGRVRLDAIVLPGTTVTSGANLTLNVTGDYTNSSATEFSRFAVTNQGHIGTGGNIAVDITGNLTATGPGSPTDFPAPGDVELLVQNTNAQIDNGGNLNLTVNGNVQVNGLIAYLQNYDETAKPAGHIGTGGNIDIEIGGNLTANSYVDVFLNNRGGGMIDSGGNLTFNVGGALNIGTDSSGFSAEFIISTRYDDIGGNTNGSFIGSDVSLNFHAASVSMTGDLFGSGISNRGGSVINGNATATWDVPGDVNVQGTAQLGSGAGGASWFVLNDIPPDHQFTFPGGGTIHGNATLTLNIGGDLTIAGDGSMEIGNQRNFQEQGSRGGTIDSDATLNVAAANLSVGGELDIDINNRNNGTGAGLGGSIGGNAAINLNLSGNLTATGTDPNSIGTPGLASIGIFNESFVPSSPGGFIGDDASIAVSASSISTANNLDVEIANQGGGNIVGNANLTFTLTGDPGDLTTGGDANFLIDNSSGGSIGRDATVNIQTANISAAQDFVAQIVNSNGTIGGKAALTLNATGDVNTGGLVFFGLFNNPGAIESDTLVDVSAASLTAGSFLEAFIENIGGTIGGNATVQVGTTGNLNADHLFVVIDSSSGGSVGGNETINMNVSGTATVNNEATVQILGPDPTKSAAINFNGGTYEIGGTFFNTIDGNGTITFNNASVHADVLKAGVFGANGALNINGGMLSADTTLKLYAPGSNGTLNFISNVTLSSGTEMDLAANTITIQPSVLVTIAGTGGAANIYTNNANYSGFGGTNPSNGTFGGAGANNPQPLASATPFGPALPVKLTAGGNIPTATAVPPQSAPGRTPVPGGNITSRTRIAPPSRGENIDMRRASNVINVRSSDELLSLLDRAAPGPGGKITIPPSKSASNSKNSSRIDPAGRLNSVNRLNVNRRAMDMRTASSSVMRRSPQ